MKGQGWGWFIASLTERFDHLSQCLDIQIPLLEIFLLTKKALSNPSFSSEQNDCPAGEMRSKQRVLFGIRLLSKIDSPRKRTWERSWSRKHSGGTSFQLLLPSLRGPPLPAANLSRCITSATAVPGFSTLSKTGRITKTSRQCCLVQARAPEEEGARTSYWTGGTEKLLFVYPAKQAVGNSDKLLLKNFRCAFVFLQLSIPLRNGVVSSRCPKVCPSRGAGTRMDPKI